MTLLLTSYREKGLNLLPNKNFPFPKKRLTILKMQAMINLIKFFERSNGKVLNLSPLADN
jgi:hypothetical protein